MVTHAHILANLDHFSYWMGYREAVVYLHAAPIFHIADFPAISQRGFRCAAGHTSEVQPAKVS